MEWRFYRLCFLGIFGHSFFIRIWESFDRSRIILEDLFVSCNKYHPTLNPKTGNFSFISFYFRSSEENRIFRDVSVFACSQLLYMSQQIKLAFLIKRQKASSAQPTDTNFHCVLIVISVRIATCYGLDGPGIESGGGEFCHVSRPALGQPSHHYGRRIFRRRHSSQSVMLTIHLLLIQGREWVGAIHPSPLCVRIGLSWVDLYLCYLWAVKLNAADPYYAGTNLSCCRQQAITRQFLVAVGRMQRSYMTVEGEPQLATQSTYMNP